MRYFVNTLLIVAVASLARAQPPQKAVIDRPLPKGAVLRLGTPRISLPGDAGPIALSPDGKQIAFGSAIVSIHDVATGIPRSSVKMPASTLHFASMAQLVWSRDGKVLMGIDSHGQCMAVDTAAGKLLWPARKAGVFPPYPFDKLWQLLGDPDPQKSDPALWALVKAPQETTRWMKERLRPVLEPVAQRTRALIAQLDSANFNERDVANKELLRLPATALPILQEARKGATVEQGRRLDAIIAVLHERLQLRAAVASHLRELRALEVLERIGTAEARKLVEAMANGSDAVVSYEAQLILARWHPSVNFYPAKK